MKPVIQPDLQQPDEFETMLDHALRARSQTGPRAGFLLRLAESLRRANVSPDPPRGWWNWLSACLSTAALAAAVAGCFAALHHRHAPGPLEESARVQHSASSSAQHGDVTVNASKTPQSAKFSRPVHRGVAPPRRREEPVPVVAETLPRLDTFPSAAPESGHPFGSGDPIAAISPEAAQAMLGLQQQQARPITLTAISVNRPLFGESQ